MRRQRRTTRAPDVLGLLVLAGLIVAVLLLAFWQALLITVAILAVPFAIWWAVDRGKQRTEQAARDREAAAEFRARREAPVDYAAEAKRAEEAGLTESAKLWRDQTNPWRA